MERVRRDQNKKRDALGKLASMTFSRLAKEVLVEVLRVKSIVQREVADIIKKEGKNWMLPIREYILYATLPIDPQKAMKLRIKAPQDRMMDDNLYRKSYMSPWLRCVGPVKAKRIIQEIHQGFCGMHETKAADDIYNFSMAFFPTGSRHCETIANGSKRRKIMGNSLLKEYSQSFAISSVYSNALLQSIILKQMGRSKSPTVTLSRAYNEDWERLIKDGRMSYNREDLDILKERREIASIREAYDKHKLEGYYNKRVRPSTFERVKKAYRDGAYKLETPSGSLVDQTWNGSNLRMLQAEALSSFMTERKYAHVQLSSDARILKVTLTELGPHNILYLSINDSGARLRIRGCAPYHGLGFVSEVGLRIRGLLPRSGGTLVGFCFYFMAECPKLKSKWEEAIIDHDLEGTMLVRTFSQRLLKGKRTLNCSWEFKLFKSYKNSSNISVVFVGKSRTLEDVGALLSLDNVKDYASNSDALYDYLCDKKGVVSRPHKTNCFHPLCGHDLDGCVSFRELALRMLRASKATGYGCYERALIDEYCNWATNQVGCFENNLYKIGATGASDVIVLYRNPSCGLQTIFDGILWDFSFSERFILWNGSGGSELYMSLPCMLRRMLPTIHSSEGTAYQACFRGCYLPCMLQRVLPIMHASEDAAYQACFEGCCLPCMLRRVLLTKPASEGVAYHACFRGCFLLYMLLRMLLTIHSSEGVAYHACLGGCCLPEPEEVISLADRLVRKLQGGLVDDAILSRLGT
uniref:Reverse transcriptase domain-containing protein n=1 Tax=Tanacetum cinerariifolium TaxID=118510 RepID=A0A6L2P7W1_TANCI|nr:reverse transcriptase domain-containing protein [Tanacetum cinerariifolium]